MIADRYAEALFGAAEAAGQLDGVAGDLRGVRALLDREDHLAELLAHPVIDTTDKQQMIRQLLAAHVGPLTLSTLLLMLDKRRADLLVPTADAFLKRYDRRAKRATVQVTAAQPLDQDQADALAAQLSTKLGVSVSLEIEVDPTLLGGLVIQVGDQVLDNSLRGRLEAIRLSLN